MINGVDIFIPHLLCHDKNIKISLVGSPAEEEQANQIVNNLSDASLKQVNNLVGQTTIEELNEILKNADLFLGHDSMTSHLAAINETQALTLSLGTVRPVETIPYGPEHFTLAPTISCFPCFPNDQCSNLECHDQIPEELVAKTTRSLLANEDIESSLLDDPLFESCSLYKTEVSDFTLKTKKILPAIQTADDIINTFYHHCWLFIFADKEGHLDFPVLTKDLCEELTKRQEGFEYLFELSGFGKQFSKTIADEAKQKNPRNKIIKEQSDKLKEIEDLTQSIRKGYPCLDPLIHFTTLELKLNDGNNLHELAEDSLLTYHQLNLSISIIYDFISKSVENFENQNKPHLSK